MASTIKKAVKGLKRQVSKLSQNSDKEHQKKKPRAGADNNADADNSSAPPSVPSSRMPTPAPTPSIEDISENKDDTDEVIEIDGDNAEESVVDEDEEYIRRVQPSWRAPIYAFFKPEVTLERKGKRPAVVFTCAAPGCNKQVLRYTDKRDATSTSNLRTHVKNCAKWGGDILTEVTAVKTVDEARPMTESYMRTGTITKLFRRLGKGKLSFSTRQHTSHEARAEIVRWVCESKRPFAIVADRGFQTLMKTGRPEYLIPSPSTVSRDVKMVFARVRSRIAKMLQDYEGDLSFTLDAWTSPNKKALIAFAVHLQSKGSPMSFLLDIVELADSHSGENMARVFADILKEFRIEEKLLGVTGDNASANDALVDALVAKIPSWPGQANRGRCFDHIVNLCARSVLSPFDVEKKKAGAVMDEAERALQELINDGEGADEVLEDGDDDDVDGEVDERADLDDVDRAQLDEDVYPVKLLLAKLRKLASTVMYSTTIILPAWYRTLDELVLPRRAIPRDVRTRWNSTYTMLNFFAEYREAIDKLTEDRRLGLRKYEVSEEEWDTVEELSKVLKVFYDATQYFSRQKPPNLVNVLPAIDRVHQSLTDSSLNAEYRPSVRAAASLGQATLNRYYKKTDDSELYRIAMVLHPSHKLEYFRENGWTEQWVQMAKDITRDEFNRKYAKYSTAGGANADNNTTDAASKRSKNMFDSLPRRSGAPKNTKNDGLLTEFESYIKAETEETDDAILWWYERRKAYPALARMALDYLTIPATSVDVERVFSMGRIILPHLRNGLSAQSIRAILCLGEWTRLGLVKDSDVLREAKLPPIDGDVDIELEDGWDLIRPL